MSEQLSVAVSRRTECGEGPIWDAAANAVHWVDIIPGEILFTDFGTGETRVTPYPEMVGAVAPRVGGGVVAAVTSGFVGLDVDGVIDRRADILPDGVRMNDAKTDPAGRFWAGSCEMGFGEGLGGLWRLDENWEATLVLPNLTQPNGMGWSPDGGVFFLVETQARQILRFDFDVESSTITSSASVLVNADVFPEGLPDGLAVDTRGHLWVAAFAGSAVHEFSPEGDLLRTVPVPTLQTTSCNFVGPGLDELWVTSAAWKIDLADDAEAGSIFRVEGLGAIGLPTARSGADVPIILTSDALEVAITFERGADIVQVVDRATGTPLFAESPTGLVRAGEGFATDSMAGWLRGYPGGWQLLVPNAGPEREHDGTRQGFHGEASLTGWEVLAQTVTSCELEAHLLTAPLRLRRSVSVAADTLTVTDQIENLSPDAVETRIVQHPAFGAPFLDGESYIITSAAKILTDADAPGSLAGADVTGRPDEVLEAGPEPGSIRLPAPGSGASLFAALTEFAAPEVTFCSPTRGLAVRLAWDSSILPHAWFWIEANAGSGWPWFRRLYAIAVEPANVLPGEGGTPEHPRGGTGTNIAAGQSITLTTSLTRLELSRN